MRNHALEVKGEAVGGAAAANGAAAVARKRKKRRARSVEDKIRIARESFACQETVTAVARRYRMREYQDLLRSAAEDLRDGLAR